ncbi:MAG: 3D domain-containing protein [Akkermansia sp.]|nr:3D domain-containing protein [Akkermansia sp.]
MTGSAEEPEVLVMSNTMYDSSPISEEIKEDFENEKIEAALLENSTRLTNVVVTHYCSELRPHICGTGDGVTASGRQVTPYVSVAVDPTVIPLGSDVLVDYGDGEIHYYRADDVGGGVNGRHIDVAVETHNEALKLGIKTATVYWVAEDCYE